MGGPPFHLVFLAFLAIGVSAGVWGIVISYGKRAREPECGNCEYPVRDLEGFHCPECGADLRVAGIVGAGMFRRSRSRHFLNIAAITVGLTVVWFFASGAIGSLPGVRVERFEHTALIPTGSGPLSNSTIIARGRSHAPPQEIEAVLTVNGRAGLLVIDRTARTFRFDGATSGQGDLPLSESELRNVLEAFAWPSPSVDLPPELIAELTEYLNSNSVGSALPSGSSLPIRLGGQIYETWPNPWVLGGFGLVTLVTWYVLVRRQIRQWWAFRKQLQATRLHGRRWQINANSAGAANATSERADAGSSDAPRTA